MIRFKIDDIATYLVGTDVVGMIGLSEISSSHYVVHRFFKKIYKSEYQPNERIVIYGKEKPSFDLLLHIQESLRTYDISNSFVLLLCPGDLQDELEQVRRLESTDDFAISHCNIKVVDDGNLSSTFKLSATMCPLPWTQIKIHADGSMAPCCVYDHKNAFLDVHGIPININTHSILDFYRCDGIKKVRNDLTNGVLHKGCSSCWKIETTHLSSPRTHAFDAQRKEFYPLDVRNESTDNFMALDLEMGNLCNLKCNICNWARSSQIAAEMIKIDPLLSDEIKKFNKLSKWPQAKSTLKKITEFANNIKFLEFEGGEPLLHIYHYDLLNHFITVKKSDNIRLRYSTNGTIFPPDKILSLWSKFKEVQLCLSIDDLGKRFEYQRANSDWKTVEQNLDKFRDCGISSLKTSVFATVNMQNIFYLPELLEYFRQYNWNVIFNSMSSPKELAISSMTKQAKQTILEKLRLASIKFPCLDSVIRSVEESTTSDGEAFRNFVINLDARRNCNFKESHLEMAEAMGL